MKQIKWFERDFNFADKQNIFPSIIERLDGTYIRLETKLENITTDVLEYKPEGRWSIKENLGHLSDLEPLWQMRLEDILGREKYLRSADLENNKTDLAYHNNTNLKELLLHFHNLRRVTMKKLNVLSENDIYKTALHPRLGKPMRTMDLFLFVAEHDDHHLARITEIIKM